MLQNSYQENDAPNIGDVTVNNFLPGRLYYCGECMYYRMPNHCKIDRVPAGVARVDCDATQCVTENQFVPRDGYISQSLTNQ